MRRYRGSKMCKLHGHPGRHYATTRATCWFRNQMQGAHTNRKTKKNGQAGSAQTDTQTDTDRQTHTHRQTDRQTDTHTQTDRQTDRQTHTHTHTHQHAHEDGQIRVLLLKLLLKLRTPLIQRCGKAHRQQLREHPRDSEGAAGKEVAKRRAADGAGGRVVQDTEQAGAAEAVPAWRSHGLIQQAKAKLAFNICLRDCGTCRAGLCDCCR